MCVDRQHQGGEQGQQQVGGGPGQCHPDHIAFGIPELAEVDRYGLGVAEQKGRTDCQQQYGNQQGAGRGAEPGDY